MGTPRNSFTSTDLWGIAVSAGVDGAGQLVRVGGVLPKLIAAARTAVPRVHTVVVAEGQGKEVEAANLVRAPGGWKDPAADFWVLPARTLVDAVAALADNRKRRWPQIDCCLPTTNGVVGTPANALWAMVSKFIDGHRQRPRYLILEGRDPASTTVAFSRLVAQYQVRYGDAAIFHVVPARGLRKEDAVPACLHQRLRRKWGGIEPTAWAALSPAERLQRFVSEMRPTEVLWVDGADRVTLGGARKLIPDVLPDPLPPGVVGVITTNREPDSVCGKFENVTVRPISRQT